MLGMKLQDERVQELDDNCNAGWMDRRMMDGQMDGWLDGQIMDGWIVGRMEGWMNGRVGQDDSSGLQD